MAPRKVPGFLRSIRARFIAWYVVILGITFLLFSIVVYLDLRTTLFRKLDDVLFTKAEGFALSINTYWETEEIEGLKRGAKKSVFSKINNANFIKIANRWVEERSKDPDLIDIMVRIYSHKGDLIACSRAWKTGEGLGPKDLAALERGKPMYRNYDMELADGSKKEIRCVIYPIIDEGRISYIVEVASPITHVQRALARLRLIILVLLPVVVVLTSLIAGEFLASITLRPLKNMIRTVQGINAERLDQRLAVPGTRDEIQMLAETFNEMLEKVHMSFHAQRKFIQDLSHEMRTPLTILKGELDVALKRDRSPERYREILRSSLEETDKISRMLETLLVLARLESEDRAHNTERVDLVRMLREIRDDMAILAAQKEIELVFHAVGEVHARLDREKMRRAFINIIDNALKYTPPKGRVEVAVRRDTERALVTVTDTGCGIDDSDLPFIFDRFYRGRESRDGQSFGLGLSIARTIVEAHGGTIACESALGRGTTFRITLPVTDADL